MQTESRCAEKFAADFYGIEKDHKRAEKKEKKSEIEIGDAATPTRSRITINISVCKHDGATG